MTIFKIIGIYNIQKETIFLKKSENERKWYIVDAKDKTLGRLASRLAVILTGKDNPQYSPQVDSGDFVVVLNVEKVKLTGNKLEKKTYYHHTFYPGGIKSITAIELLKKHPEEILKKAVSGMLPKNKLRKLLLKKLKIYTGTTHPHLAQKPEKLEIEA